MKNNRLRFALLIRVSTEGQKEKTGSLETQTERLKENVKTLGGVISFFYKGQEHATADYERKMFEQLLEDSAKDLFDAVIVYDLSRFSRSNLKSKQSLKILLENNIRFFVGTKEYDLYDDDDCFFIGMSTEMNELEARRFKRRSIDGKITKAQKGTPPFSKEKLPFGRTFDKKTEEWSLVDGIEEKMKMVAERFIKGEGRAVLAKELGITPQYLWKIFKEKCGDTWTPTFRRGQKQIPVEIKIPRLLSPELETAVHKRIDINKNISPNGQNKYEYILGRMIFCSHCKQTLTGYPNRRNRTSLLYYRHVFQYDEKKKCKAHYYVPSDNIEKAVLTHLFKMFGDVSYLEDAMSQAIPDTEKIDKLRAQDANDKKELTKLEKKADRIVDAFGEDDTNSKELTKKTLDKIGESIKLIKDRIEKRKPLLENVLSREDVKREARIMKRYTERIYRAAFRLGEMSFDDKRKLVLVAFDNGGKDNKGKRLGVWMEKDSKTGVLKYTINGVFKNNIEGKIPMSLSDVQDILDLKPVLPDDGNMDPFAKNILDEKKVVSRKRKHITSKLDKYNNYR